LAFNIVADEHRGFAKSQRRIMTRAENDLWRKLRGGRFRHYKFRRQVPLGDYVGDFVCLSARLIVELDGAPHQTQDAQARDAARDRWLISQGFRVMRFQNDDVLGNIHLVLAAIEGEIATALAPPLPTLR